jgi:hypothetical protein
MLKAGRPVQFHNVMEVHDVMEGGPVIVDDVWRCILDVGLHVYLR